MIPGDFGFGLLGFYAPRGGTGGHPGVSGSPPGRPGGAPGGTRGSPDPPRGDAGDHFSREVAKRSRTLRFWTPPSENHCSARAFLRILRVPAAPPRRVDFPQRNIKNSRWSDHLELFLPTPCLLEGN